MSKNWLPDWTDREGDEETRRRGDAENRHQAPGTRHQETVRQDPEPSTQNPELPTQSSALSPQPLALTPQGVMEALKEVIDPELAINIVDLGLVYGVDISDRRVHVRMTLTSPGCPLGPMLQSMSHAAVRRFFPQVEDVKVEIVWSPPWDPYKMASEEAKDLLGIW